MIFHYGKTKQTLLYSVDDLEESPDNGQLLAPLMNSETTCEKIIPGRILYTTLKWGKEFNIEFDITVDEEAENSDEQKMFNVFHFTKAADACEIGISTPFLFSLLLYCFFSFFSTKVSFFLQCSKMQLIPLKKFNIQTCFFHFFWFFRLKC